MLSSDDGETHLALFESQEAAGSPRTVAFRVDAQGFMSFLKRLEALELVDGQGRRVTPQSAKDHGNAWSVYFTDPDGNSYEITTYEHAQVSGILPGSD